MKLILERVQSNLELENNEIYLVLEYLCSETISPVIAGYLFCYFDSLHKKDIELFYQALLWLARYYIQRLSEFHPPEHFKKLPIEIIDVCGTGGDSEISNGKTTLNISTLTSFIVSASGVPVVKHGNGAVSSISGSSDVLKELRISDTMPLSAVHTFLRESGLFFIFAPKVYPFLGELSKIRSSLSLKTIFNLVGPLANPFQPDYQVVGISSKETRRYCSLLRELGRVSASVVSSASGYDEVMPFEKAHISTFKKNLDLSDWVLAPEKYQDLGLFSEKFDKTIEGGVPEYNAYRLLETLQVASVKDANDSYLKSAILNAGVALYTAGKSNNLRECITIAIEAVESGEAFNTFKNILSLSQNKLEKIA